MRQPHVRSVIPRQQQMLSVLRAVTSLLTVPLFAAIVLSPIKHGLEEYEVFIGLWALMALPLGVETAQAGSAWRPARRWLGVGLAVVAIASLVAVIRWIADDGPTGVGVLALGTALVTSGPACQIMRVLEPAGLPSHRQRRS